MSCRLSELITQVRSCKTAESERARINEECALIRTALKDEASGKRRVRVLGPAPYRERNMLKLMFVHMLGYSTHWAQMECVTMIASPHFHEKRAGYLGLMLLLDETTQVLTLVTHQLSTDLQDESPLVNSLALATLANIASADMARDLHRDVERHLATGPPLTRKKAALACIRLFKAAPDLIETFIPRIVALLTDRTHATIMTGTTLMWHLTQLKPSVIPRFAKAVPHLVKLLRKLVSSSNVPNYTIGGVCDPFLQSKLLQLLRVLGKGNAVASETMNDVLAQVATRTDASRTAGNAILYDAVQCILDVQAEEGLRVLAVNILGRFLLNKENNIRYVALNTLSNIVEKDLAAVARHRSTIVSCLSSADSSLRRRALELVYALTDKTNIKEMAGHMVNYAVIAEQEERVAVCARVTSAARRFAPSMRWEADTLLVLLAVRGESARKDVVRRLVYLITAAPGEDAQASLAHKVTEMLLENKDTPDCQAPLVMVAAWTMGEYSEELLLEPPALPEDPATSVIPVGPRGQARTYSELVDTLGSLLNHHKAGTETRGVVLTAITKLLAKGGSAMPADVVERARGYLGTFSTSLNQELQARSVEFLTLTDGGVSDEVLAELAEPVPVLTAAAVKKLRWGAEAAEQAEAATAGVDVHEGEGEGGSDMQAMTTETATAADAEAAAHANMTAAAAADGDEVLMDLFGSGSGVVSSPPPAAASGSASGPSSGSGGGGLDESGIGDLFGAPPQPSGTAAGNGSAAVAHGGQSSASSAAQPSGGSSKLDVAALYAAGPVVSSAATASSHYPHGAGGGGGGGVSSPPAVPQAHMPPTAASTFPETDAVVVGPVRVTMQVARDPTDPLTVVVTLRAYRASGAHPGAPALTGVVVESAVAKYMSQSVGPPDSRAIPAGSAGPVTRTVRMTNPQRDTKPFKLLLRAQCTGPDGTRQAQQADVTTKLPAGL